MSEPDLSLDDHDACRKAGDDAIAAWKIARLRLSSGRVFRHQEAAPSNVFVEGAMFRRIDIIHASREDGDGARVERALVRRRVDPACET